MYITIDKVRKILKKRKGAEHKGDFGHLLIVAGSEGMTGAAILAAKGAFRTGAGLVYMYVPKSIFGILQISIPEAICLDRAERIPLDRYKTIVFGPGLGVSNDNRLLLRRILSEYDGTVVIDADGLNLIAKYNMYEEINSSRASVIYTPHEGEAARHIVTDGTSREERAVLLTEKLKGVSALKGRGTIVTDGKEIYINTTGNPGMATAGSGDVLSGIIGALCAQGYGAFDSALCGVFVHGLAGDIAARDGQWGITASDVADKAQRAIKNIIGE